MVEDRVRGAEGALAAIERACAAGLPTQDLIEEVAGHITRVIPSDSWFVAAADPETALPMGAGILHESPLEACQPLWDHEFLVPDFNLYTDLATSPRKVGDLHEATGGRPQRSARWRELNAIAGWDAELRAVFMVGDATWGMAQLNRVDGGAGYRPAEIAWLERVAPVLARGLRASMLSQASGVLATPGPGILMLDGRGKVVSANAEADLWLRELEGAVPLPSLVQCIATRARAGDGAAARRARVRTPSGLWLLLHVSSLRDGDDGPERVVLVIEPARASDVAPVIVEAYELTPREVEVTRLVARGMRTAEIAERLFLSPHTVRDHVKAVFEKVGVSSRGELVAKVFAEHYLDGLHDAMGVTQA